MTRLEQKTWPRCTVPDCTHGRPIPAPGDVAAWHWEWVSHNGHAVCVCHALETAETYAVTPFPCVESEDR